MLKVQRKGTFGFDGGGPERAGCQGCTAMLNYQTLEGHGQYLWKGGPQGKGTAVLAEPTQASGP